jgi:hypothetical protein
MNIRSPEERYGGEGHAGTDPHSGQKPGRSRDADSSVEVPNATVEELIEQPKSGRERNRKGTGPLARQSDEPTAQED